MKSNKTNKRNASGFKNKKADARDSSSYIKDESKIKTPAQDWTWYASDAKAAQDMASFAFNKTIGYPIVNGSVASPAAVPGFIAFHYKPTLGYAGISDSNYQTRAANVYYQYITQGFTSINTLEATDLYFTGVAAASLISAMINFKRAYGMMRYYLQQNRYFAKNIVTALGFNFDNLSANMANARAEYNLRAATINKQIAVPKNFKLCDRWEYVSSYVFSDSTDPEYATMYGYVPDAFMKYDATTSKTGTCLKYVNVGSPSAPFTVDAYFSVIDSLITALTDEDVRDSFAAIRRVYNDSDLKKISPLDDDFASPVAHTDVAALQAHNMITSCVKNGTTQFIYGGGYMPSTYATDAANHYDIAAFQTAAGSISSQPFVRCPSQSSPDITTFPRSSIVKDVLNNQVILDLYDSLGTPQDILDITANMQIVTGPGFVISSDDSVAYPVITRSEHIYNIVATYYIGDGLFNETIPQLITNQVSTGTTPPSLGEFLGTIATRENTLSRIDSHPLLYTFDYSAGSTSNNFICGELDKYTTISAEELETLHNRCMYQLTLLPSNTRTITR